MPNEVTLDDFFNRGGFEEKHPESMEEEFPELQKGWKWARLKDISKVLYGKGLPRRLRKPDGLFGVYGSNGIMDRTDEYLVEHPTIIIGRKGSVGALTLVMEKCWPIDTTFYLKLTNEQANLKYIYLALKAVDFAPLAIITAVPGINREDLENVRFPLPPLEEQKRIVARFEEIVSRIEQAERLREEAMEDTEAIMQSALHQTFSKPEEKGWEMKKLKECCRLNPSKTEVRSVPDDLEVTFVPMKAVNEIAGRIETPNTRLLREVRKGYTYFKEGDVLFAKITPCMENGKSAIASNLVNGMGFGSTEFHIIRTSKVVTPEWVYFWVRQESFREMAAKNMTGTAGQQRVPKKFLEDVTLSLPPIGEQKRLVGYLKKIQNMLLTLRKHQERTKGEIEAITQGVLKRALSGRL